MKPNILFILIDSFRADKCYGDEKTSITPNIDNLIQNGIYFSQTICSAPVTCPSVSSIITSKYPFESVIQDKNHFKINPKITTYIDDLVEGGYQTYAIIPELISYMGLKKIFRDNIETYTSSATLYDGLGNSIIERLESTNSKEPWFFYIHLLDLHGSATFQLSDGPEKFQDKSFGSNQYERMVSAVDEWLGKIFEKIDFEKTLVVITADHGSEVGVYTEEIENYRKNLREYKKIYFQSAHKITSKLPKSFSPLRKKLSDAYSKRKREKIKTKRHAEAEKILEQNLSPYKERLLRNSIESTLEVYDDRFRVPLIFAGYNIKSHKIVDQQVRSIDIFPTIASIIGITTKDKERRGQNLSPLFEGSELQELPVMVESAPNSPKSLTSNVIGIRTSKYKYFRNRTEPKKNVHLFDLIKDPLEENNIASLYFELIDEMENILLNINNNNNFEFQKQFDSSNKDDENEIIEQELKKLGYI